MALDMTTVNPIRVLHVMPQIGTGGAERQLYELIVHSDPDKVWHQVFYYSDAQDDEMLKAYKAGNIPLTRVPRSPNHPVRFLKNLAQMIRAENPDIVHCWLVSGNFWGRLAAICARVKHIIVAWRNCDLWKPIGARLLEWLTYGRAQHLANSRACAEFIAKRLWISPDKFTVIYNGLETGKFNLPNRRKELFAGLNIPDDHKIITMVGRLMEQKNYPMLLRIAQKAKQIGLPVVFVVVGTGVLKESLIEMSRRLNVADRVHFIGLRNDIPDILASSNIFLFTTNYEGFPNALLEAMAARLPVVTTNFCGVDELIRDGQNGIIVPVDDADAAAEALRMYVENPERAKEYGNNAYLSVESVFSMSKMVEETESLYQKRLKVKK
jgi:glycosyltransferase involved in cell wall biosynthesis